MHLMAESTTVESIMHSTDRRTCTYNYVGVCCNHCGFNHRVLTFTLLSMHVQPNIFQIRIHVQCAVHTNILYSAIGGNPLLISYTFTTPSAIRLET